LGGFTFQKGGPPGHKKRQPIESGGGEKMKWTYPDPKGYELG